MTSVAGPAPSSRVLLVWLAAVLALGAYGAAGVWTGWVIWSSSFTVAGLIPSGVGGLWALVFAIFYQGMSWSVMSAAPASAVLSLFVAARIVRELGARARAGGPTGVAPVLAVAAVMVAIGTTVGTWAASVLIPELVGTAPWLVAAVFVGGFGWPLAVVIAMFQGRGVLGRGWGFDWPRREPGSAQG